MGVLGNSESKRFMDLLSCKLDRKELSHSFLYVPKSPLPLLGRDSLHKLGATIHLDGNIMESECPF